MREIKFRWWNGVAIIQHENIQVLAKNLKDMTDLMQYTGLKDKNGKEIYEGDILDDKYFAVTVFKDGAFVFEFPVFLFPDRGMKEYLAIRQKAIGGIKVIGNIYENPELLEETNER